MEHVITNPETGETQSIDDETWLGLEEEEAKALSQFHVTRRVREWKRAQKAARRDKQDRPLP